MEQRHAHDVLNMMVGKSYTEESLIQAIKEIFGEDQKFYACSAEGMDILELIDFLKKRGKFMPAEEVGFTVDMSKVCSH